MDMIHKLLDIVFPILTIITIILVWPVELVFKFFSYLSRSAFREDLAGKVVLITGASSGIGEYLAYEYAKRGARLALVARREELLEVVAGKAREMGSSDVIVISADVSKLDDCKRFVDETINHFGSLDHLVNNAGICWVQDQKCVSDYVSIMTNLHWMPLVSVEGCAKTIVDSTSREDEYLMLPAYTSLFFHLKHFCPWVLKWITRFLLIICSNDPLLNKKPPISSLDLAKS
ncbi:hypothetical protein OSB04_004498 [Centaurea solstitialis]|uniref:Uncharacterized protein n=1 Tax=Centaurea solstitialis TaxID=347529 RepID=A0AA38WP51_9ASTR|nr:hypothetical protein OSB04_004498 [Centaurea solstitialis]